MANMGQVQEGDFVYDPFAGTGSIILACQYFNSFTFGGDLDIRVLKGYGVGRKTKNNVPGLDKIQRYDKFTNFHHYKMQIPEIFVMDCSTPAFCTDSTSARGALFDSIVCDPPYGVRARSQKVGVSETKQKRMDRLAEEKKKRDEEGIPSEEEDEEEPHFSMKEHYDVNKVYSDLLQNATKLLRKGGRLVFLYHTDTSLPAERNKFPEHPDFEFVCSSENNLTKCRARHLITLIKK